MNDRRRLHPAAIFVSFLQSLRELIVPIMVAIIFGRGGEQQHWFFNFQTFVIIGFFVLFLLGLFKWLTFTYQLKGHELVIRQGIFIKKRRFIRQERIQSIDISAGMIQRMFKLVQLRIETAGGGDEPEVKLIAITKSDAEQLRETLLITKFKSEENAEHEFFNEKEVAQEKVKWKLSRKDLFIAALTSSGIGLTLSAVGALFTQFEQFLPETFYENTFGLFVGSGIVALIFFFILIVFIAWVISIAATMLKYGHFTINKNGDELVISRGIIEQRHLTLSLERITGIRIVSSILRQPFGLATVYVESAGGGSKDEQLSTILFPLVRKWEIRQLIERVAPEFAIEYPVKRVPKRALLRYLIRALVPTGIVMAAIIYIIPYGVYSLVIVPFAVLLGYLQYRDAGYGISQHHLWFRSRTIGQTVVIMPKKAIQSSEMYQTLFQKRRKLATANVSILSSVAGKTFKVKDLGEEEVMRILEWFSRSSSIKPD